MPRTGGITAMPLVRSLDWVPIFTAMRSFSKISDRRTTVASLMKICGNCDGFFSIGP